MIVGNRGSLLELARWQQRPILLFATSAGIALFTRVVPEVEFLKLPAVSVAILGGALGIFVSFRTNAAYARWWEGRQLWGRLINLARTFASQVLAYLPRGEFGKAESSAAFGSAESGSAESSAASGFAETPSDVQRRLLTLVIVYVHVLRCLLREQDPWADADVLRFSSDEERARWKTQTNATHAIAHEMTLTVADEANAGRLSELRLDALDRSLGGFLDVQGGCERLKKTPMPRAYGFFADRLTRAFGIIFPFAIVDETWIFVIPLNVLLATSFIMIAEVGRVLEDPFSTFWNGLPLSALSRTIESNLRDRLGEKDVLPLLKPDDNGVLM